MKQYFKYFLVLAIPTACFTQSYAQKVKVDAHLEKSTMLIGDQTKLHFTVTFSVKDSISFPTLADSIKAKLLIVSSNKADTSFDKNDLTIETIDKTYTLTSFDTGQYVIPQYQFKTKTGSMLTTTELVLTINPVAVDTTKAIYDIKQPLQVSYSWVEWLKDNWPKVAFPILAVLAIVGLIYYLRKRPKTVLFKKAEPEKPEHQIALDKLYALRDQKLWQQDRTKEYHSEISEVMRDYLEKRYQIHANEQTTDEIFASIRYMDISEADRAKLKQILVLADLVKFAKERPLPGDNEQSMNNAIDFIMKTQKVEVKPIETKEEGNPNV